jgi:hypothetical protein
MLKGKVIRGNLFPIHDTSSLAFFASPEAEADPPKKETIIPVIIAVEVHIPVLLL